MKLIDKSALVAEIKKRGYYAQSMSDNAINGSMRQFYDGMKECCRELSVFLDTLEVIDPYEQWIQHSSIEEGIKAHAEEYSFNIESELFNQLTKEQQALWRKEIEQAVISGGYNGLDLARDPRYKENSEVKEVDLELITGWFDHIAQIADNRMTLTNQRMTDAHALDEIKCIAKNSSEFIIKHYKAQKGE